MLTQQQVKEILNYDKNRGIFTWKFTYKKCKKGDIAGKVPTGNNYRRISFDGQTYMAHRLVWLYMTGEYPQNQIDHINGIKYDNRWCNLREANSQENCRNRGMNKNNTSGKAGVYKQKNSSKWLAACVIDKKSKRIGTYDTKEEASQARNEYCKMVYGEFYRDLTI